MKKVLLLCLLFILSNSIYAQETAAEKKARIKTEKAEKEMARAKLEASKKTKESAPKVRAKIKETGTKTKVKTTTVTKTNVPVVKETKVIKTKPIVKETKVKVKTKTPAKFKETNEKAPRVPDKVTGQYNGKKVYTGPRGGRYYINSNGNKTYIED